VDRLPDNNLSMKLPDVGFAGLRVRATTVFFFSVLVSPIACVSLDKPAQVAACSATHSCVDDFVPTPGGRDAAQDGTSDLRVSDEPVSTRDDVAPDGLAPQDASPDKADSSSGKSDVAGSETSPPETALLHDVASDPMVFADSGPEPTDLRSDPTDVPIKEDVVREDIVKEDVVKEDVVREDVVREDVVTEDVVREDVVKQDVPGPETLSNCLLFYGDKPATGTAGHPPGPGSSAEFCVVTCDDVAGWGCSNFDSGRKVTVNGTAVNCGVALTKQNGYYVFRVSAGTNPAMTSASIYWWSNTYATTCSMPAAGM